MIPATVNYTNGPTPQAIGAAMMPMDVTQAQAPPLTSSGGSGMMGLPPQSLQQLGQNGGLQGMSMFGGAGNPLGLSSGTGFTSSDLGKLRDAFTGAAYNGG